MTPEELKAIRSLTEAYRHLDDPAYELAHRATIAYLLDRAEQYTNSSGYRALLDELVEGIAERRHVQCAEVGEYDDLWKRVDRIVGKRREGSTETERLQRELATMTAARDSAVSEVERMMGERDAARAECERLKKHVEHNDEEHKTMKEVLRAEHEACDRMRPVYEAALRYHGSCRGKYADEPNDEHGVFMDAIDAALAGGK